MILSYAEEKLPENQERSQHIGSVTFKKVHSFLKQPRLFAMVEELLQKSINSLGNAFLIGVVVLEENILSFGTHFDLHAR